MSLKIIYEDNHVLIVIKPSKVPSQADKTGDKDMLTIVKEYIKEKYNKPGDVYVGLVHRLDRMTSGLMVFAKTSKAASRISKTIREGDFKKEYTALVYGTFEKEKRKGTLEDYLLKNEETNVSKVVKEGTKDSKQAILDYEVIEETLYNGYESSYIRVKLKTGRTHQIRVQFANIDHPIVGDIKYGKNIKGDLALFASKLTLFHPTKDEVLEFSVLPDNTGVWKTLGNKNI